MAENMSKEEDSNKALEKISLPFHEIKVWLSCTQRRHIKFAITNPTNVTIGFHLRSTRPSAIKVYPTYGFIEKHDFAMAKVYFPKVDEHDFKVRADRLTVLLAVKPEDLSISEPKLLWDEKDYRLDVFARRCITVKYSKPFENQMIKTSRKSSTKGKETTDEQINEQKRQSHKDAKTNAAAQAIKTVQSNDSDGECEEEGSTEDDQQ